MVNGQYPIAQSFYRQLFQYVKKELIETCTQAKSHPALFMDTVNDS